MLFLDWRSHSREQFSQRLLSDARLQAAVLLQGLLTRRAEQRLTVSKALHIMATLGDSN